MKLHLPLSLRSSLLTCMAALAGAFTTLASGTAIVGTVVLTTALSATASAEWAPDGITYTGTVSIDAATTEALTVTENSLLTYTYAGLIGPITATNLDIRIAAGATTHMMAGTNVITAKSLWISEGRLDVSSAALDHAGTIYAQGGQMFVAGGQTIKNAISLGSTTYTEGGNAALSAAIRLANNATLSGKISLVEDGAVSVTASTNGKITGAIATNGFAFEKTGAGTLDFSAANSNKFDKLVLNGGVLRSSAGGHNTAVAVTALDIKSTTTLAHNGWNSVWTIGALTSSAADSSDFTLTLDQQGTHFFRQTYIFNGTGTVDAGSLYSGLIDVKNTGSGQESRDGIWRVELQAGTNQLSKAVVNLNNHAIMAVTADQLELKGLTSTNANAYVFSGASTDKERNTGTNNPATPHFVMDGTVRTLTLSGSDDYSFTGTLAGNLVIEKTGAGKQTFGNIGENVTINLHSGSLWLLGTVGEGSTIMTDAGTTVDVPWAITTVGDVATAVYGSPEYIKGEGTINLGTVAGIGDTALSTTDGKYTILDATGYTKSDLRIVSGLLSIFANGTTSPADFGSIETFVLDGGGLVANATNSAETYTFDKNIQVVGNGYVRVYGNETTSANMVVTGSISGSGTLVKTDGGQLTLAGDMSQFKGKVNLGNGTLAFDTNATLAGLTMTDHTKLGVYGGHSVVLTSTAAAPWVPSAGTFTFALEDGGDFSTSRIRFTNATTLNLTTSTHGSITVQGLQMADTGTSRINIGANTTLNIMGTQTAKGQSGGAFNQNTTLLLAHYNADSHIDVEGTLNMLYCGAFGLTDRNATMRVANGAELNLLGLDVVRRTDFINDGKGLNLTFDQGSALHLGAEGIGNATTDYLTSSLKLTFKGGTIGILSSTTSWSTNTALTFTGDVVVDTRYYAAATDGTKGTYSQAGGTINMLGAITGDGKLIKRGEGTLTLTNVANLAVEEGYVGAGHVGGAASGTLTISGTLQAMTEGGGRFLINLGDGGVSDQIVAANYGNQRVNLSLVGGSAGTYTVFNGGTGLTDASNIDLALYLNRGLGYDAATGLTIAGGVVQVTLTGEASTENYDLTWAGETNETWSNNAVEAWEGDAGSGNRFSAGDRVIFNGGGLSEVVIDGIVTPGSVTVTGTQDYTISGGKLQGAGALTKEGDATLTLDTDTSGWTGEINLSGGTLAFTGSLGAGNVNLSGTSVLSWLEGNTTDLSSRLKIAADSDVTFSIAGRSKVIFNSAITPLAENETAHFTKAGAGTLMIQGAGALRGDLVVSEGTLEMGGASSNAGAIYGGLTVKSGAKVLVNRGNFTGWLPGQTITRLLLEQDSEIVLGAGSAALTHTIYGGALTMNGATISSTVAGNAFEFTEKAVATIGGSKQSIFQANMVLDYGDTTGTIFNVADATGDENVDFLVTGGVTAHRGNTGLDKQGAGTMEITGKYEAGKITLSGGKLILHGAKLQGDALGVAAGTTLQFAADSSSSWALTSDKTLENGTFLLDRGATLLTNSNNTYHLTLSTGTVLAGEGTLIVGTPTNSTQTNGDRRLILNGSTAGFTGYVDVQASAGNTGAYRGTLILNSADAAFGGIVRTQGVTFGSPATADDAVVPEMAGIIVQKSMSVGGFDGKGGMLTTDVADGQRITLTLGRDDNHAFGGSVGANIDLVKTGTGKQVFSGNLPAYNGTTTVQQGTLDLGAVELKNNIALTGTGASLTAGMVTLTEAGKTLTISATGTVLSADVRLRDMTISLGSNSLDLAGHKLSLSGYAKCNLSLTLGDDLQAGDTIDLFTGAKVSVAGPDNIGMEITNKTVKVTDLFNTDDPWLQDAIVYFDPATSKLQIILSRGTGSLVYGRGDNGVWATGEFFEAGENGAVFEADQNVSFNTLEGTDTTMTVQIKGALSVGAAYVDAGAGNTYRFEQHADLGSIAALKNMTIAGGTASFAAGTLAPAEGATITVKGATLALDNGATNDNVSLALTDGATLKWNTGNTTDYAAGNRLSIADGANVTLDVNGNRVVLGQGTGSGATGSGGHITLADTATGGSLVLGGSSALHGTLDLGGQTLRLDAGDHYDLKLTGNGNLVARGEVTLTAANDFAGTLTIGDNTDATGNNGSADTPVNGTLNVTDASLGSGVTGIALVANGDGIGSTLNYAAGADATLAAAITGTGDVNITGGHIVTLTGANTYAGKTGIGADTQGNRHIPLLGHRNRQCGRSGRHAAPDQHPDKRGAGFCQQGRRKRVCDRFGRHDQLAYGQR